MTAMPEALRTRWTGLPYSISIPRGRITGRVNQVTGEIVDVPDWVNDIDAEDIEWHERQWAEQDAFDYKLRVAGVTA